MEPEHPFRYRDDELYCDEVSLRVIAETVGTPCYVYSARAVAANYHAFAAATRSLDCRICYAVKANSNLAVLRLLRDLGSGFDIVSGGELYRLRCVEAPADGIVFSGVGKTDQEIEEAVSSEIFALVIESESELERISEVAGGRPVRVSFRINPEVEVSTHRYIATGYTGHKFGIDQAQVPSLLQRIRREPSLELIGVGFHIGSQILSVDPYITAVRSIRRMADELREAGFPIDFLDIGGGFGIPYGEEPPFDLEALAARLLPETSGYRLIAEPGRFLVGAAGALVTTLLHWKENHGRRFAVVDAGMNDLIRPALYQARHRILPVRKAPVEYQADVVGPICETADFLGHDCPLPALSTGEQLAVLDAGAYGFVASSNYNGRRRAAEVLVEGSHCRVVRRRETFADLIRGEMEKDP